MPFLVVSGVGREMGVLDGVVIVDGEGAVLGVNVGHPIATNGDLRILCRDGWRRGFSQITLGFFVNRVAALASEAAIATGREFPFSVGLSICLTVRWKRTFILQKNGSLDRCVFWSSGGSGGPKVPRIRRGSSSPTEGTYFGGNRRRNVTYRA